MAGFVAILLAAAGALAPTGATSKRVGGMHHQQAQRLRIYIHAVNTLSTPAFELAGHYDLLRKAGRTGRCELPDVQHFMEASRALHGASALLHSLGHQKGGPLDRTVRRYLRRMVELQTAVAQIAVHDQAIRKGQGGADRRRYNPCAALRNAHGRLESLFAGIAKDDAAIRARMDAYQTKLHQRAVRAVLLRHGKKLRYYHLRLMYEARQLMRLVTPEKTTRSAKDCAPDCLNHFVEMLSAARQVRARWPHRADRSRFTRVLKGAEKLHQTLVVYLKDRQSGDEAAKRRQAVIHTYNDLVAHSARTHF